MHPLWRRHFDIERARLERVHRATHAAMKAISGRMVGVWGGRCGGATGCARRFLIAR
jgi:hypothetical protein